MIHLDEKELKIRISDEELKNLKDKNVSLLMDLKEKELKINKAKDDEFSMMNQIRLLNEDLSAEKKVAEIKEMTLDEPILCVLSPVKRKR